LLEQSGLRPTHSDTSTECTETDPVSVDSDNENISY